MNVVIKIAYLFILLSISILSYASFDDAVAYYEEGKIKKAFNEFKSMAEIGHKASQFNLGILHLEGSGTEKNLVKAYGWIKLSDHGADNETELLQEISQRLSENKKQKADLFYSELFKKFSTEALKVALEPLYKPVNLNSEQYDSPRIKPIKQEPAFYPREAQLRGLEGWVTLSFFLNKGGTPSDISVDESFPGKTFVRTSLAAVEDWRFEVPDNHNVKERYRYRLEFKLRGGAGYKSALSRLKEKAEAGDAKSQYLYAKYGSELIDNDEFNPTVWFYRAAEQGVANAQYELAQNLLEGKGCVEDKEKAIAWLIKSASADLGRSHFKLAKLFFDLGNKERAYFWLDKAVKSSDSKIAFELAKYIDDLDMERYPLKVVHQLLQQSEDNTTVSPIRFYEYLAEVSARLDDYDSASKYQFKANMAMKRVGNVPFEMINQLDKYQELRDKNSQF
ncbi:TonB family protein [Kangiella sediminilitoris]|uniref:TonB family protein n=1 Tax=Kangiella sediminilitoris TaxID=1144748 RepID=A0A1B3BB31_9GAMM|nr:TonB family protein [Kangiella sediminilitoris]AOE50002.1 TonB family protein [Kangiella sediminilitoris]